MPDMEKLKRYAIVTDEAEAQMLQMCMDAAQEWYKNAGVDAPPDDAASALYDLGVYMLALHYYDNRGRGSGSFARQDVTELPQGVFSILHQLRP